MLKDALKQLIDDTQKSTCKIAGIVSSVDNETAELLVQALRSDIPNNQLVRLLQSEGIKISREYLRVKRNDCFNSSEFSDTCCMSKSGGSTNETAK